MKAQTSLLSQITESEMKILTAEVKETIAKGYNTRSNFSAADLWNIQRQRRAIRTRRIG